MADVILCKAIALGLILLLAWGKGTRRGFDSKQWERWMLSLSEDKLVGILTGIYLPSAALASLAAYGLLKLLGFQYAPGIALVLFILRLVFTYLRYRKNGREYLCARLELLRKECG